MRVFNGRYSDVFFSLSLFNLAQRCGCIFRKFGKIVEVRPQQIIWFSGFRVILNT